MSIETWQRELRRRFGREQLFSLTNIGAEFVFSDFEVRSPQNNSKYRVAIRGAQFGENHCACADFAMCGCSVLMAACLPRSWWRAS